MRQLWLLLGTLLFFHQAEARMLGAIIIEGVNPKLAQSAKETVISQVRGTFTIDDVEKAMEALYASDDFNGIEVFYEENGERTDLIFKLSPVRHIHSIAFKGNSSFASSDLLGELAINEGDGLVEDRIKDGVENVKKFYNLSGYLNAEVSAEFTPIANSSDVNMTVVINEQQPCRISAIIFLSANQKLNSALDSKFSRYARRPFSQNLLNTIQTEAGDYVFDQKYYSSTLQGPDITYDALKTSVTLTYTITEPYAFAFVFEGNNEYTSAQLIKELKIENSNRLASSPVDDLTERVTRIYKKAGYANVVVHPKETFYSEDFIRRLSFTIEEGSKVRIKAITFDGNFSRPEKYYRNFLTDHAGDVIAKKLFNSEDFDTGVKNLVTELQNQGFISAKVPGTRVDFDKRREFVTIKITLEEGPQTFVQKVVFNGIRNISKEELEERIGFRANTPLHLNTLEQATANIIELYRSKGYLEARILNSEKSIVTYSEDNTKATLNFDISEGPLITVGSIIVTGNSFTKDYVIRRELQFEPGEVLTPEKISYSEERLQRLSLFSSIDIQTLESDPVQGSRTVLVRVSEREPGILKTGVGLNNDLNLTVKGYVGAAYRNLWGTGREVNARAEGAEKLQYTFLESDISFGYTEPFIFNTRNTARFSLAKFRRLYGLGPVPNTTSQTFVQAVDSTQADTVIERDLTRRLKLIYEFYGISHLNYFDIAGAQQSNLIDIATTGPTLVYDRRQDDKGKPVVANPVKGYYSTLTFEFSDPRMGSTQTVNYHRTTLDHIQFIPLGPLTWQFEGKAGYERNISPLVDGAIPTSKSFQLGGRSTIRGFNPLSEAFPSLSELGSGIKTESYYYLVRSELHVPIYGNFGIAGFYDGGYVNPFPGFNPQFPWRDSAGAGLRYKTPIGPVSLDYGFKLNRDANRNEGPGQLYFSISSF